MVKLSIFFSQTFTQFTNKPLFSSFKLRAGKGKRKTNNNHKPFASSRLPETVINFK